MTSVSPSENEKDPLIFKKRISAGSFNPLQVAFSNWQQKDRLMRTALIAVFVVYLMVLVKLILLKGRLFYEIVPTASSYVHHASTATYTIHNFVPFRNISMFLSGAAPLSTAFFNLGGNIMLWVPFGFLLPLLINTRRNLLFVFSASLLLSTSFEIYQLLTHTGQCDVDDVILNTLGGLVGYFFFCLFKRKFQLPASRHVEVTN